MVYVLFNISFETNGYGAETMEGIFSTEEIICEYLNIDNITQIDSRYYRVDDYEIDELIK